MKKLPGLLVLITLLTYLAACKKMDADLPPAAAKTSLMNVVNATADTLNTFQNGTRFNYTSSFYPGGSLGYLTVVAGEQQYQIKKDGTPNVLVSLPLKLDTNQAYSFFIAGKSANEVFLLSDNFLAKDTVQARFVNASPGLSFDIKIGNNFIFANRTFKSATNFIALKPGVNTYELYEAGATTPLAQGTISLAASRIYTLYTKGSATGTGDNALGLRLIANR